MKIQTILKTEIGWERIFIEVQLIPGLPDVVFLGNPHHAAKETAKRVKCAIRAQGFELPRFQQIIVDLSPHELKKNVLGLDLAVAFAYLIESQQISWEFPGQAPLVWGELGLDGKILPCRSELLSRLSGDEIVIANFLDQPKGFFRYLSLSDLNDFKNINQKSIQSTNEPEFSSPAEWDHWQFPADIWDWLGPVILGGHSLLLAGPAGAGKTSLARLIWALRPIPDLDQSQLLWGQSEPSFRIEGAKVKYWYPWQSPHYSIPRHSLIGGGIERHGGVVSKAHGGVMLLDEMLEFSGFTLETLRQVMESRELRVQRGGGERCFPIDIQWVATTNLCPCGEKSPLQKNRRCQMSLKKCNSYADRLSGPLIDRFEVTQFLAKNNSTKKGLAVKDLRERIQKQSEFRKKRVADHRQSSRVKSLWEIDLNEKVLSERRKKACRELTISIAAWHDAQEIGFEHYLQAAKLTIENSHRLQVWDLEQ